MSPNALSLFSGAGGMDVGFRDAGVSIATANEIDPDACETFRANHAETKLLEGDIDGYLPELGALKGTVDIVFGGPPCQGFSVAGKMDHEDPRSKLVFRFCEVVELVRPRAFVMENVKSLSALTRFSDVRSRLISRFHQAGYTVTIQVAERQGFRCSTESRKSIFRGSSGRAAANLFIPSFPL